MFKNPKLIFDESNSELNLTRQRLVDTFNSVGWPVIQSGSSTVLGMIPLFFVDAYVVDVFWKTIILVTILGLFHALFLLPVLFITIQNIKLFLSKKSKNNIYPDQIYIRNEKLNDNKQQFLGLIRLRINE